MTTHIINNDSYLRTSRNFPMDAQPLSVEINRSYVDIANAVNNKMIGIFPVNAAAITGESWYINGPALRQQTLREVYTATGPGNIPHGLNLTQIANITRIYGTAYDGTNYYPLPYVDVVSATNQINIVVTGTNIVVSAGAGSPPSIISLLIVIEWLSNV